ncbi:MFS transporter [Cognatishimia maritima]|uniref:Sugar phosphate permease n=1 Tax=Cognatishimia maritima TaxID=870908 RepID=A0A1M5J255_9RHOB|nr:MFS transporter [Cognatishimia maritima]SHG34688.1 Sugar phosphate permease [Cognatishimia maritima]
MATTSTFQTTRSIGLLLFATMAGMSLWFMGAAVIPDMAREAGLEDGQLALLSSVVPAGFALGAMGFAISGVPDRFDPRHVFAVCATVTAVLNAIFIFVPIGTPAAGIIRFLSGIAMAGTWPLSMKIAVGWSVTRRGTLMGTLVGALVIGQAAPYLMAWIGGTDWRLALWMGSGLALLGAAAALLTQLGPHHVRAARFDSRALYVAWQMPQLRRAILGYLCHMWEFIAFWSWVGVFAAISFSASMPEEDAQALGKLAAFLCIIAAAPACALGGVLADRIGKAHVAATALILSGTAALLTALTFGGPVWITFALLILWGAAVVPDSPQFSAIVADYAPAEIAGSVLTLQASLGFLLTALTVQIAPSIAAIAGWPAVMVLLAMGPVAGVWVSAPLRRAERA